MPDLSEIKRILIVDDEANIAMVLAACATRIGRCAVEVAYSGQQALTAFEKQAHHLVITDYRMPDMSGLELARAMRSLDPTVIIILMTAYDTINLREEAARLPVNQYLEKPISIAKVQEILAPILSPPH
jgi:CheY-like chemotaxis protein